MRRLTLAALFLAFATTITPAADVTLRIDEPMSPPAWALLERSLLDANAAACRAFFDRYFDDRGYLLCVERWGGNDGPDDAIENINDWPLLHALGAPDDVAAMYRKAWEGHLRQYTEAKTIDVELARDGMYYKEFPVCMDWLHNAEGLTAFNLMGLSDAASSVFRSRVRRFAGFYLNDDPGAPNYDPEHRIIRSLFNGSRGPLLRKATALDWAGDPIEVENRFKPGHGERSYAEMIAHFKDYNDVIGDHPQNLLSTSAVTNAYMLDHEPRYRDWVLEYVDAWVARMAQNGDVIPTNIGLDGTVGGAADGKWYGGVYGWGFTVEVPQTGELANRNTHAYGFVGMMNAYLLTGDDRYLDCWRRQITTINAQAKEIDGTLAYPTMYGDDGWYGYVPTPYLSNAFEIAYLSAKPDDRALVADHPWLNWLDGKNDGYAEASLQSDLGRIRVRNFEMNQDTTTPDTRLADDSIRYNPASVQSLVELMLGGPHPGNRGALLHSRLRYFDPERRRAGIPPDVAALVEGMTDDSVTVTLVNTNQLEPRRITVQAGAYAEHQFVSAATDGENATEIDASHFDVELAPGAGKRLVIAMRRHANQPTLAFPWH